MVPQILSEKATARLLGRMIASDFALYSIVISSVDSEYSLAFRDILLSLVENCQVNVDAYMAEQKNMNLLVSSEIEIIRERYIETLNFYIEKLSSADESDDSKPRHFLSFTDL